jgi:hypothetical protein
VAKRGIDRRSYISAREFDQAITAFDAAAEVFPKRESACGVVETRLRLCQLGENARLILRSRGKYPQAPEAARP